MHTLKYIPLTALLILSSTLAAAGGLYQKPADFVSEAFAGEPPHASIIWLDKALKKRLAAILQHPYHGLRIRYWKKDRRTVWVLDEIGKEKPITVGIIVQAGKIERLKILAFRESRGWEVRHAFFTDQFQHAGLTDEDRLDRTVDNISGATLSVRAVSKLARLALFLDHQLSTKAQAKAAP